MFGQSEDTTTSQANDQTTIPTGLADNGTVMPTGPDPASNNDQNVPASPSVSPGATIAPTSQVAMPDSISSNVVMPDSPMTDNSTSSSDSSFDDKSSPSDLSEIKTQALKELTPLVDKLDQPPIEKFRTLMMTIQAADNKDLIPKAYEAAHQIDDQTLRAQALLDIVNEINYFSQLDNQTTS